MSDTASGSRPAGAREGDPKLDGSARRAAPRGDEAVRDAPAVDAQAGGRPADRPFVRVPPMHLRTRSLEPGQARLVVAMVVAVMVTIAAAIISLGVNEVDEIIPVPPKEVQIGPWTTLVSQERPSTAVVLLALLAMVTVAGIALALEAIATLLSLSPRRRELMRRRGAMRPAIPGPVTVTVLVPAHNEEVSLPGTLTALTQQERPPDRIIVVADNCTDRTVQIAREMGFEAFETVDNSHSKGGALNQALRRYLPTMGLSDVVMVIDADTQLDPRFVDVAAGEMETDPVLSAVGGIFYGEDGNGLIGQLQRNEYTRYALQLKARNGRVFVLTGTASMFRVEALLDVAAARGVYLPGETGNIYDTSALTEDNELTLALKTLGATMKSPQECRVTTEIMPTWRNLWKQRQRWQRGALENIGAYGLTRATVRYWGQQVGIGYGTIALNLALLLMVITFFAVDRWIWFPFWMAAGLVFLAERVITVWRGGWRARLLAAALVPELCYDLFLQAVFVNCLFKIVLGQRASWGHVQHQAAPS